MGKSPEAFRTISEVADWLGIQAHVLRFWESKFSQVKPVKRAGGRRYYRPNDMLLLGGIKKLLYEDGLTIKGAQKVLREEGIAHVAAMSPPLDDETAAQLDAPEEAAIVEDAPQETGVVLSFENGRPDEGTLPVPAPPEPSPPAIAPAPPPPPVVAKEEPAPTEPEVSVTEAKATPPHSPPPETPAPVAAEQEATPAEASAEPKAEPQPEPAAPAEDDKAEPETETAASLPAFLRRPMAETPPPADNPPPVDATPPAPPPAPKPRVIEMPVLTPLDQIDAKPGVLTAAARVQSLSTEQAKQMTPLLARLTVLRDSMAAPRRQGAGPGTAD